jgi:hypothetical protein
MKNLVVLTCCGFVLGLVSSLDAAEDRLGGMLLLPGYQHVPLQGFDSVVGQVAKKGELLINYEIGGIVKPGAPRFGGSFTDRPKLAPKESVNWYREQTVAGQSVHLAHRKDGILLVSFPEKGINFSVKAKTSSEMADALLMILTYPNAASKESKKNERVPTF